MTIEEPEDGRSYGIAEVVNWIEEGDLEFPLSKNKISSELGGRDLMLAYDETVQLSEILDEMEDKQYDTFENFLKSLGEEFRAVDKRAQRYL